MIILTATRNIPSTIAINYYTWRFLGKTYCCLSMWGAKGNIRRPATDLLLTEDEVVELLLQDLVRVVDQELLEVIVREDFKP